MEAEVDSSDYGPGDRPFTKRINPRRRYLVAVVPNWLMEQPNVSANAKLLYGRLMEFADERGVAWPTIEQLMRSVAMSQSSVQRALRELTVLRLIESEQLDPSKPPNRYFLDHPWAVERADFNRETGTIPTQGGVPDQAPGGVRSGTGGVSNSTRHIRNKTQGLDSIKTPPPPSATGESPNLAEARGIVDAWWERQSPAPIGVGRATLAKRVQKLIAVGWPETMVIEALDLAENFTEAALEGRLRRLRAVGESRATLSPPGAAGASISAIRERPACDTCEGARWIEDEAGARRCPECNGG